MEKQKLKVAVVGGGVMGLYISWKLAEAGHEVSLFDRKKEDVLGKKCCSALVSERIKKFVPIDDDCIENEITSCVINFPKGKVKLNFSPKHLALKRELVIARLLELNQKAGTRIVLGQEIRRAPQGFDRVIGCDGAFSIVRRSLGLPDPGIRNGIQAYSLMKSNSHITQTYAFNDLSGFCWKIPKGDKIEYGAMGEREEVEKKANKILGIEGVEKDTVSAAVIPCPHFPFFNAGLIFPKEKNITLCGDAMGLTKPWSGGGIIWGLHAADILVKTFPDFRKYKKETVKFFRFKILKGQISNYLVQAVGKRFPGLLPKEMKYDNDFPSFSVAFKREK
ncbi:MAG: NAD(P)-binding protein [Candidatus Pacebacteria bacterium]|nr:NAD(P)-binding protein [Candidatus Paceibacterota bacterium]